VNRRLLDGSELHPAPPGNEKGIEPHGVGQLLLALHPEPLGTPGELLMLAVGRHRQVAVKREELVINLFVDGRFDDRRDTRHPLAPRGWLVCQQKRPALSRGSASVLRLRLTPHGSSEQGDRRMGIPKGARRESNRGRFYQEKGAASS